MTLTGDTDAVKTFTRQYVVCGSCGDEATTDAMMDRETGEVYWMCPECGMGNRGGR